jgi:hypothetical protein
LTDGADSPVFSVALQGDPAKNRELAKVIEKVFQARRE